MKKVTKKREIETFLASGFTSPSVGNDSLFHKDTRMVTTSFLFLSQPRFWKELYCGTPYLYLLTFSPSP